jgi:hypothetical protein
MLLKSRTVLEQKIARAERLVAAGADRVTAQRTRLEHTRGNAEQSKRLLRTLEDTQVLLVSHLEMLKREWSAS